MFTIFVLLMLLSVLPAFLPMDKWFLIGVVAFVVMEVVLNEMIDREFARNGHETSSFFAAGLMTLLPGIIFGLCVCGRLLSHAIAEALPTKAELAQMKAKKTSSDQPRQGDGHA